MRYYRYIINIMVRLGATLHTSIFYTSGAAKLTDYNFLLDLRKSGCICELMEFIGGNGKVTSANLDYLSWNRNCLLFLDSISIDVISTEDMQPNE